jgi:hypothetical protein
MIVSALMGFTSMKSWTVNIIWFDLSREVDSMFVLLEDAKLACNLAFTVVYARDFTVQGLLLSKILISLFMTHSFHD